MAVGDDLGEEVEDVTQQDHQSLDDGHREEFHSHVVKPRNGSREIEGRSAVLPVLGNDAANKQGRNDGIVQHVSGEEAQHVAVEVVSADTEEGVEFGAPHQP